MDKLETSSPLHDQSRGALGLLEVEGIDPERRCRALYDGELSNSRRGDHEERLSRTLRQRFGPSQVRALKARGDRKFLVWRGGQMGHGTCKLDQRQRIAPRRLEHAPHELGRRFRGPRALEELRGGSLVEAT